ncbi:MAG: flagellar hook-basal body protein [Ignavibacteriales bacterium]|nr:flagellar hook-basal body protein [Ignavibacteriales bacterium]
MSSISTFMRPMMLKMQVVANNLANINSSGFKKGQLFIEVLQNQDPQLNDGSQVGEFFPGVRISEASDFSQGVLEQTNNPFDFAIDGPGFFAVETGEGVRFTRAGNFSVAPTGELITKNGYTLLGENDGAIILPNVQNLAKEDVAVSPLGDVLVQGVHIGKMKLVTFENVNDELVKIGTSLFHQKEDSEVIAVDSDRTFVRQGFLEGSNVDGIDEMIQMIELTRQFESGQRIIQSTDESVNRSLEIGRF